MSTEQSRREVVVRNNDELAERIVALFIEQLENEATVKKIVDVWSKQIDRTLGQAVRRAVGTVILAFLVVVGVKLNAIVDWLKG